MNNKCEIDFSFEEIVKNIQTGLYIYRLEDIDDDSSLRLIYVNAAAEECTGVPAEKIFGRRIDECFPNLRRRGIVQQYAEVVRLNKALDLEDIFYKDDSVVESWYWVKAFPLPSQCVGVSFENITEKKLQELENVKLIHELCGALAQIKTLKGLIPVCLHCKRIRDDDNGYWKKLESYLAENSGGKVSHGICPECVKKHYPRIDTPSCWEFKNCSSVVYEKCPAFIQKKGKQCWLVVGSKGVGKPKIQNEEKYTSCNVCDYYKFVTSRVEEDSPS